MLTQASGTLVPLPTARVRKALAALGAEPVLLVRIGYVLGGFGGLVGAVDGFGADLYVASC